jgi:hypothetical protein
MRLTKEQKLLQKDLANWKGCELHVDVLTGLSSVNPIDGKIVDKTKKYRNGKLVSLQHFLIERND